MRSTIPPSAANLNFRIGWDEVEKLDNVYLYNVDDLQSVADKNKTMREHQRVRCSGLVENQTDHFMRWLTKEFGPQTFHG